MLISVIYMGLAYIWPFYFLAHNILQSIYFLFPAFFPSSSLQMGPKNQIFLSLLISNIYVYIKQIEERKHMKIFK